MRATLLVLGLVVVSLAPPAHAKVADPPDLKPCSKEQESEWRFVHDAQLGVQARALSGADWVGLTAATDGFHDWAPLDDFKTTICGELSRFGLFEPSRSNELTRLLPEIPEHDWNLILVPTRRSLFDERFNLAKRLMERGHENDLETCDGQPCFEAEVTPPPALLKANAERQWLSDARHGQTLCTFGPWVGDGGHGYRPEIHPAERIWWCDGARYELVAVQDASQRFTDHRQFQWADAREPKRWRPWAGPGIHGEFRLAFEIERGGRAEFRVNQALDRNTRGAPEPIGDATPSFTLREAGQAVGEVVVALGVSANAERLELDRSRLSVGPTDACVRGDGRVQGFLSLRDRVGYSYPEGEGFDVLDVVQIGHDCDSASAVRRPAAVEKLHLALYVAAKEQDAAPADGPPTRLLEDLLRAATADDEGEGTPTPGDHAGVGPLLSEAARQKPPQLRLQTTRRFRLSARPHYDGPREDALERAVDHADAAGLKRLLLALGAPVPAAVGWSIHLRDVTDGHDTVGACVPGVTARMLEGDECEIALPDGLPPTHVVRVLAAATFLDSRGAALPSESVVGSTAGAAASPEQADKAVARQVVRLSSHFIRLRGASARSQVLAWLGATLADGAPAPPACGEPPDGPVPELVKAATAEVEAAPQDGEARAYRRGYYARMLRHGLVLASADDRLTLDELNQMIVLARGYASPPCLDRVPVMKSAK